MPTYRALILTAILPEAKALIGRLHLVEAAAPVPFWKRGDVALAVVGVRANRLGAVASMPGMSSVQGVVMAGLGGALSPELRVGDVLFESPGDTKGISVAGARRGTIYTSDTIVATPADKQRLF